MKKALFILALLAAFVVGWFHQGVERGHYKWKSTPPFVEKIPDPFSHWPFLFEHSKRENW